MELNAFNETCISHIPKILQSITKQNISGLNANLLESNSILPNGLSAFMVTGIPAQDKSLWQPQRTMFALTLRHHHTQEKD